MTPTLDETKKLLETRAEDILFAFNRDVDLVTFQSALAAYNFLRDLEAKETLRKMMDAKILAIREQVGKP